MDATSSRTNSASASPSQHGRIQSSQTSFHLDGLRTQVDDIAIIGMSCRTSGGNDTPEKLWDFLMEKGNASGKIPAWRWDTWRRRDLRNNKVIDSTIDKGYFITNIEDFDASFFGISPKEAEQMDPHQRLGLELAWEALEDAGVDPKKLAHSDTAVFMGVYSDDYSRLLLEDLPNIEAWMGLGSAMHGVANRISYHLDLQGPSAAVDAACASSMVAVDSGRQTLQTGQSSLAIVGGVNVALSPALFALLDRAGALAPDGVCRSFDDEASGYARGEGGAVLILKRLPEALSDGDNVLGVLKASAVAQDGKTNGIMAPNPAAQEHVARKALTQAGLDPLSVGYVEAHATSTSLGDPTEVASISAVYGNGRTQGSPALVGSIKPNIGHLEAAAGVISVVKTIMAVRKGQIPPQANLKTLNTKVDWTKSGLHVVRESTKWGDDIEPRRAAVCSYGYGGTVTHAIFEQPPNPVQKTACTNGPAILVITAPQEKRLPAQCQVQADWIATAGQTEGLHQICSTLAQHRAQHEFRTTCVVENHLDAADLLRQCARGEQSDWVAQGRTLSGNVCKGVVWLFSGHGAQWTDMGKDLMLNPVFHDAILAVDGVVSNELGWSIITALKTGQFSSTEEVQVLTYATQIGLAQVLFSKGLRPQAILGHSVGEIAAAATAGCITLEEGATIVARRARLYTRVCGKGGMRLVAMPFQDAATELAGRTDIVAAIDSSPSSCVISGSLTALAAYADALRERGVKAMRVKTDVAFHSPTLESLVEPLHQALDGAIRPQPCTVALYSTSQADPRSRRERDVDYWAQNMVRPVRLTDAVTAAVADGYRLFVEVSTHPIIQHSVNETLLEQDLDDFALVATMVRERPVEKSILHCIAQLYIKGARVDFDRLLGSAWSSNVPKFAWSHKPFWKDVGSPSLGAQVSHDPASHGLVGFKVAIAGRNIATYQTELHADNAPFPQPHMLHGTNILPAAVYVNTFFQAAGVSSCTISDIALKVPLAITDETRTVQVVRENGVVKLFSRRKESADHAWVNHSSASIVESSAELIGQNRLMNMGKIKGRIGKSIPVGFATDMLKQVGVDGMAFPWGVRYHYSNGQEMLVEVDSDPGKETVAWDQSSWAPTVDAATSISFSLLADDPKLRIVSSIKSVAIHSKSPPPKVFHLYITEVPARDQHTRATNVAVLDRDGTVLADVEGIALTEVHGASGIHSSRAMERLVHRLAWVPARFSEKPRDFTSAILISQDVELRERYTRQLSVHIPNVTSVSSLGDVELKNAYDGETAIIYCPPSVADVGHIATHAQKAICEATSMVRFVNDNALTAKVFVITSRVYTAACATALAQSPLYGLARVIAGEHSDIWGGLIDHEGPDFPMVPLRYIHGQDVIRFVDGLPWIARLRPLTAAHRVSSSDKTLLPRPEGTYIVTGGLGDLGLETCDFLIEKGARRLVLISRRKLPPRSEWPSSPASWARILGRVQAMEKTGASIHVVALDLAKPNASDILLDFLDKLSLPPIRGVVHAAGVMEDSLLLETTAESYERVLSPKVSGALTLHNVFPPGTLDFFVLFSSVGQLVGMSGQSSYASGNAFLDCLAEHRRQQGDNAVAFLWTAWRALGMGASDLVLLECQGKGISDIARDEGFAAWEHMSRYDLAQCVVTPVLAYGQDETIPSAVLEDVVERRHTSDASAPAPEDQGSNAAHPPADSAELKPWINQKIRESVASVMKSDEVDDIDSRVALSEIGVDSVMSIPLRKRLQDTFKIKIPQTMLWNYPTIDSQVEWLVKVIVAG